MQRIVQVVVLGFVLAGAGCQRASEDERMSASSPPPATAIAPVRSSMSLAERLAKLEQELSIAVQSPDEMKSVARMIRAEAITDGLLEPDLPHSWLSEEYRLESRVRQVQAAADRIVAQLRRGARWQTLLSDAQRLHKHVARLRLVLDEPGGEPPVPLDSLLAGAPADAR